MRKNINELVGSSIKEAWSGSVDISKTFSSFMRGFVISNDGSSDLTFTVNSMTITVKSGETFEGIFDPFTSLSITTTVAYRALVKG